MFQLSKLSAAAGARLRRSAVIGSTVVGGVLAPVLSAHAALPAEVTTALETAGEDGIAAAGLVLVAIIGIYAVKLVRRAL